MEILILDNRDSFVHNISTLLEILPYAEAHIVKGDDINEKVLSECDAMILSPGPGIPSEHRGLLRALEWSKQHSLPTLGICLGMQALAESYGAKLYSLPHPLHGHASALRIKDFTDPLLKGIGDGNIVGRYHSWAVDAASLPSCITVSAFDADNLPMVIRHTELPLYGVQFHPESIITENGDIMLSNFLNRALESGPERRWTPV